jgi:S1-C subfamily serine protease
LRHLLEHPMVFTRQRRQTQGMTLVEFSRQLATLVEKAAPAVVAVRTQRMTAASGILYRAGLVLTADHALQGQEVQAVELADGRMMAASVMGRDPGTDLAVLKLHEELAAPVWPVATDLKAGHLAVAVGRAPQLGPQAAMGIVSLTGEAWRTMGGGQIDTLIRLDMGLHPTQSGGAVVDAEGRLMGMATRGLMRSGAVVIPVATLDRVADAVVSRGRVVRGYLGVGLQPVPLSKHLTNHLGREQAHGLIVVSVETESPAETAGVLLGDVLTAINGKPVDDTAEVLAHLDAGSPGRVLEWQVLRGGRVESVAVTVGERE